MISLGCCIIHSLTHKPQAKGLMWHLQSQGRVWGGRAGGGLVWAQRPHCLRHSMSHNLQLHQKAQHKPSALRGAENFGGKHGLEERTVCVGGGLRSTVG